MDVVAARIAAEPADRALRMAKAMSLTLVDAGNEEIRRHALHVVAAVLAAREDVADRVAIARVQHDLAAKLLLERIERRLAAWARCTNCRRRTRPDTCRRAARSRHKGCRLSPKKKQPLSSEAQHSATISRIIRKFPVRPQLAAHRPCPADACGRRYKLLANRSLSRVVNAPLPGAGIGHREPRLGRRQRGALLQDLDRNVVRRAHERHAPVARRAVDGVRPCPSGAGRRRRCCRPHRRGGRNCARRYRPPGPS